MLKVADLQVRYGNVEAVGGVSLTAERGQVTLVLGANGAGKTSTLKAIVGLLKPYAGQVTLDGDDITGLPAQKIVRRGVVLVPEGRRVFSPLSVADNLRMGGYVAAKAQYRQTLEHVYDMFPVLAERRNYAAGLLSGGEQQMLAFGRALMSQPRVMLLDEPSMGLAPVITEAILAKVREMADAGIAVVMVEQNAESGVDVADQVVVLARGLVAYSGTAAEARNNAALVRAFLGEVALTG
jgi:branched-chain amino acid transport system ATP-binding protein